MPQHACIAASAEIPKPGELQENTPFNVIRSWKCCWVTADVDCIRRLINADPVHTHLRGECEVLKVDKTEVLGKAKIDNKILQIEHFSLRCNLSRD
jgi:hypothetical protein